jgi:hypothetical protein
VRLVAEVSHCLTKYFQRDANVSRIAGIAVFSLLYQRDIITSDGLEAPERPPMWITRIDLVAVLMISLGVLIGTLLIMAA